MKRTPRTHPILRYRRVHTLPMERAVPPVHTVPIQIRVSWTTSSRRQRVPPPSVFLSTHFVVPSHPLLLPSPTYYRQYLRSHLLRLAFTLPSLPTVTFFPPNFPITVPIPSHPTTVPWLLLCPCASSQLTSLGHASHLRYLLLWHPTVPSHLLYTYCTPTVHLLKLRELLLLSHLLRLYLYLPTYCTGIFPLTVPWHLLLPSHLRFYCTFPPSPHSPSVDAVIGS